MDRPNNPSETKYLLIGEEEFERLLRSYYILGKGLLAFEYLCGHSDRPMYLSAEGVCEVLGITRDELDEHRLKRQIKAKVFQRQMMYSLYDLVLLAERLVRHKIRYRLSKAPRFDATANACDSRCISAYQDRSFAAGLFLRFRKSDETTAGRKEV